MPKFDNCDKCVSRKAMYSSNNNEFTRMCAHPELDKPRRIVSGLEIPKWCPRIQEEIDLKTGV